MLKLGNRTNSLCLTSQPPSGGCVLKQYGSAGDKVGMAQPPSGGCVLKLGLALGGGLVVHQPPSGGCVLKHENLNARDTET